MARRQSHGIGYFAADMLRLPLKSGTVDVIIDKGSLEVLWVDAPSQWDPGEKVSRAAAEFKVHGCLLLQCAPHGC